MKKILFRMILALFIMLITSCGQDTPSSSSQGQGYKDTKAMVIDVLKTEEGQQAIQEAAQKNQDKTMQMLQTKEGQQIQLAVKDIFTDVNGSKLLQQTMTDPKFAGEFAKAIEKSNKQLHKDLMKDPEYQKSMMDIMNNAEFERMILRVMKNNQYRQQMMVVIQESIQTPLFRAELMEIFTKVLQEESKPKLEEKKAEMSGGDGEKEKKAEKDKEAGGNGTESKEEGGKPSGDSSGYTAEVDKAKQEE